MNLGFICSLQFNVSSHIFWYSVSSHYLQAAGGIESQMIDGMEHVFTTSAPLRFGRDLRLNEVF
jgi:hypothetical protein